MAKSPSKEDRERLAAAIEVLWVGGNSDKLLDLIGIPEPERSELRREGGLKERARSACAEILYDAIVSAHDRIDELEEGDAVAERVVPDWVSARGLVIKEEHHISLPWMQVNGLAPRWKVAQVEARKRLNQVDDESLSILRKMSDFGFSNGFETKDYERLQALRRLGYIRHCYSIENNFYFWILKEKGYAYLREFDRNSLT